MRIILSGKNILNRVSLSTRFRLFPTRTFCSSPHNNKPTTINNSSSSSSSSSNENGSPSSSSSSLSQYNEQYKALNNLDFMTAAKILFTEPPQKKKFGLDFHLVQLFFVCLPSLAVYLVAQYARSEMKKMDAELELKKQAEFEAKAKEMEKKSAEEKAAAASDPVLLEVKERLHKLEETVKEIVVESKKQSNDAIKEGQVHSNKQKQSVQIEPDNNQRGWVGKISRESTAASIEGKTSGLEPVTPASRDNQKAL